jgi:hypothetical protein
MASWLLEIGAGRSAKDYNGCTPAELVLESGNVEMIELFKQG